MEEELNRTRERLAEQVGNFVSMQRELGHAGAVDSERVRALEQEKSDLTEELTVVREEVGADQDRLRARERALGVQLADALAALRAERQRSREQATKIDSLADNEGVYGGSVNSARGAADADALSITAPVPPPRLHPTLRVISGYTTTGGVGDGGTDRRSVKTAEDVLNRIVPVAAPRKFRGPGRSQFQSDRSDPPLAREMPGGSEGADAVVLRGDDDEDSGEIMGRGQNGAVARVAVVVSSDLRAKPSPMAALKVIFNYHGAAEQVAAPRAEYEALLRLPRHRNIIRMLWQGRACPPSWVWANCMTDFVRELNEVRRPRPRPRLGLGAGGPAGSSGEVDVVRLPQHFMLLELLPMTLQNRLQGMDGIPPYPLLLSWARDIAEGLLHLHRHGVVHRDMKLDNVMWDDGTRRLAMLRDDAEGLVARGIPVPATEPGNGFASEAGDGRLVLIDLGECLQMDPEWGASHGGASAATGFDDLLPSSGAGASHSGASAPARATASNDAAAAAIAGACAR